MGAQWSRLGFGIKINCTQNINDLSTRGCDPKLISEDTNLTRHEAWRTGLRAIRQAFTILAIPSTGDPQQAVIPRVATGFLCNFTVI